MNSVMVKFKYYLVDFPKEAAGNIENNESHA